MSGQRTDRLHGLLESPFVYRSVQRLLGAGRAREVLLSEYVRCAARHHVLDVGCGTADVLAHLPAGVRYTGIDPNGRYLAQARRRYGGEARFLVGRAGEVSDGDLGGPFDRILMIGLLHHLTDEEAAAAVRQAARLLAPRGVCVTLDNVRLERDSLVARWLIAADRGARVRSEEDYLALLRLAFPRVEGTIRRDLLRVPYSHFIARSTLT